MHQLVAHTDLALSVCFSVKAFQVSLNTFLCFFCD